MKTLSKRAQRIMIWWAVTLLVIYALSLGLLFNMIPPPRATLSIEQISDWYAHRHTSIRLGAVIASWTSAFLLPLSVVIAVQLGRLEGGRRVWSIAACASGVMSSIFLVLPPMFWGVAAYTPSRDPQATALMHELGMLTLVTAVQYFIFMFVAVVVFSFRTPTMPHSPFPRWFGYFTAWVSVMFEVGPIAFLTRTGPFAWDGLLVFWAPTALVVTWISVMVFLLLKAIKHQEDDDEATTTAPILAATA
ncbi:hypothetical protein [Streptomyces sp. NPDC020681]|uniref:hypothetical protein n=1 Tax=Streptomyces sp. NPDC020681 TaxID=3365083 RepID=UPI00378C96C8